MLVFKNMVENEKNPKKDQNNYKKSISLFGVKFEEVVAALLMTEKPKEDKGKPDGTNIKRHI